jgi:hypothetical protein
VYFVSCAKQMPESMLNYAMADSLIILSDSLGLLAIMKSIWRYTVCVIASVTKLQINILLRYEFHVRNLFFLFKTDQINSILGNSRT